MNLKERGVTIGDLLIILVILVSTILLVKKINNQNESSSYLFKTEIISLKGN